MAKSVVSFVVQRVGRLVVQEAKFLYRVGSQIEFAQTELQLIQGFLKDADIRQREDAMVRVVVAKVRNAAYELEDVVEIYFLRVANKSQRGITNFLKRFGCVVKEGIDLHNIGPEIWMIIAQLSTLRSSLQSYNIREIGDATSSYKRQQQLRRTYSHIIERDVIGLEDSVEELVMHLVKKEFSHRVVSIWGMGGLGKTTLAKQIYHHTDVRKHFICFVWVCITQQYQVRSVWEGILIKLLYANNDKRTEIEKLGDDEIAKEIYLILQYSRCLIVVDDIWTIEAWESLKHAFPLCEESGSMVLLTNHNKEEALYSDRNSFIHQPRPLNDDESWILFEKIAISGRYGIASEFFPNVKDIGKKMLQYCAGLALVVTVLAGLLARRDTIDEWETVLKNIYTYLRSGKGHGQGGMGTSWLLLLSYDCLSYYLKPRFLYLSQFPEDFEIPTNILTQLWVADCFISMAQQRQGFMETMEEIAFNYLTELVERCMVEIGNRGSIRKIKSCRFHDLRRDMCLLQSKEESFFQIVNLSQIRIVFLFPW